MRGGSKPCSSANKEDVWVHSVLCDCQRVCACVHLCASTYVCSSVFTAKGSGKSTVVCHCESTGETSRPQKYQKYQRKEKEEEKRRLMSEDCT